MRPIYALAVAALIGVSAPALAQNAGNANAVGTGGGLTGGNTPGAGTDARTAADPRINNNGGAAMRNGGMSEGRAASGEGTDPAGPNNLTPNTVQGDQVQQQTRYS